MSKRKVLFIIGAGHCGSSLLALILGSHPQCFSAGELGNLPNRYRKGLYLDCVNCNSEFWDRTFGNSGLKQLSIGLGDTRVTPYIPLKLEKNIREFLGKDRVFKPYTFMLAQLGKEVIIDASKYWVWVDRKTKAKEFKTGEVEAYLLNLVRDGRAIVNSYLRKYPQRDMATFTQNWMNKTKRRQEFYESFDRGKKIEVAYEQLASDPHVTVQKICEFLEIEFTPDMIEYWKYDHHDISGNDGTYSLVRRYQQQEMLDKVKETHGEYYEKIDLGIKLDLRWKKELREEKLEIFNSIAGEFNQPYAWD
ncbi:MULTISPECIES: sulfotransferase [unclassified Roseofilum]|uniref:sulfotransferase family protein n=1 Tax=unclassified Roseofilum TaxID=2620099 RepID=UPI000E83CAD7|nr:MULTISPECIES: sulfotransferase [unclassified Roseofilum]MBP0008129.1 sulfotransferase [Roseofilum sp. Belize Diploria]MBP0032634.1 sulfotransferase [Roseofilum sp. Belize BBD 4]HBR00919.1 sulfotransferase [Cyanobacteria bacterium UBA11691]